ncbi:hypothetical protein [Dactylosporangium sp. NPDC048998]|uniref:hypothetical protein n=1 Tax=Dactylosporangium sp. NPDC048998 TaxID=3363976 RepID=UPI00371BA39A
MSLFVVGLTAQHAGHCRCAVIVMSGLPSRRVWPVTLRNDRIVANEDAGPVQRGADPACDTSHE